MVFENWHVFPFILLLVKLHSGRRSRKIPMPCWHSYKIGLTTQDVRHNIRLSFCLETMPVANSFRNIYKYSVALHTFGTIAITF